MGMARAVWLWPRQLLCWLVVFYQKGISPLKPPCCRFTPTCSEYAKEAFRVHGVLKGGILTVWRVMRCHPFYRGTLYDPVPPRRE